MRRDILSAAVAAIAFLTVSAPVDAALISRLDGAAVYDTDLNITWLADANYAATDQFGVVGINTTTDPGAMDWDTAITWISAMNDSQYLGVNSWRLPNTPQIDGSCSLQGNYSSGFNCTGSEMGHLFYSELSGIAGSSIHTSTAPDLSLFSNIQDWHWSGSEFNAGQAWYFYFNYGGQAAPNKSGNYFYAWAVANGDVFAPSAVPVPTAAWLFGSGLFGLLGISRKQTH